MIRPALPVVLALAWLVAGCERRPDDVPVEVSAIGGPLRLVNPNERPLDTGARLLLDATAQGLVRFDANGQVEPALAERWIVMDDGRSYIFRLRAAEFPDGRRLTAGDVVEAISRVSRPESRNPLKPFLEVVDEVVEMTPQVIEVRLKRPRPDFLKLLAQPEMAIFTARTRGGSGPFRITEFRGGTALLKPVFDPSRSADQEFEEPSEAEFVRLRSEPAASALIRFRMRRSDLVAGGTFNDWPLLAAAGVAPANLRIDPAVGLFGLAVISREGLTGSREGRSAIAMAIDRQALTAAFRLEWQPVETILPSQLDSALPPVRPAWVDTSPEERMTAARALVSTVRARQGALPPVRIAVPRSPGGTLVFGHVGAALRRIGADAVRVNPGDAADLRLIDAVAPYDSARWYLVTACRLCSETTRLAIDAARDAPTLDARAQRIAEADRLLTDESAFIPIAQPLRWSIVALRLGAWQGNSRAWHPLGRLRDQRR